MKELYLFNTSFEPDCASTNRVMAFAKGFAENGVKTTLFFWKPSASRSKASVSVENLQCRYLWEECRVKNRYLNQLFSLLRFFFLMKRGIPVLSYDFQWLHLFSLRRGVRLFHERTEHPEVIGHRKSISGEVSFFLYRKAFPRLSGLFVISPSLKEYFAENFDISPEKVHIINMIVDSSRFDNLPESEALKQIGYCGTISEYKDGIDYLIEAFAKVHGAFPEYRLAVAGRWENETVRTRILERVAQLGIGGSIDFKGLIPSTQMPAFLKSCQVLALARPFQPGTAAGFASKIGEYLMTGRPVVMTDLPDVSYFLRDGIDVFLARPNDAESFARKLEEVIVNCGESAKVGACGREKALRIFNYNTEAAKAAAIIFN